MPVTQNAKQLAGQFASQQPTEDKARRVYLNTLAVCAIDNFLRIMGVPTNLKAGDSWNPAVRFAADIADLTITGVGRLECRPSIDRVTEVYPVPPEACSDRIGYTVVHFDETQMEATLLGFVPTLNDDKIRLRDLQPIDKLLVHLARLKAKVQIAPSIVALSRWIEGVFEDSWQALETLFAAPHPEFAFRLKHQSVKRAKSLNFEHSPSSIALTVALDTTNTPKIELLVGLYPLERTYLPPRLKLVLLDEEEKVVMEAETRHENQNVQFEFRGETGDRFSVRVELGEDSIVESFVI